MSEMCGDPVKSSTKSDCRLFVFLIFMFFSFLDVSISCLLVPAFVLVFYPLLSVFYYDFKTNK